SNGSGTTTLTKVGSGTLTLTGANTYSGTTTVTGGKLFIDGATSGQGNYSFGTLTAATTLGGTGTIGLASTKTLAATGVDATKRAVVSPGDGTTAISTLNVTTSGAGSGVMLGDFSTMAIDVGAGANNNDK